MSFVDAGPYYVPRPLLGISVGGGSAQTAITSAADDAAGLVMRSPVADTLNNVGFLVEDALTSGAVTVNVSLQGVDDTTGLPDGTPDQNVDVTSIASNTFYESGTLGRVLTLGERFAIVLDCTASTSVQIYRVTSAGGIAKNYMGGVENYWLTKTAGTWTKAPTVIPLILLKFASAGIVPIPGVWPLRITSGSLFKIDEALSSTLEYGNTFTFSHDVYVDGAWFYLDVEADTTVVHFRDSHASSSPDATYTIDKDCRGDATIGHVEARWAPRLIPNGQACVLSVFGGASASGSLSWATVNDAAYWSQMDYMGDDCHWIQGTTATAPSGWTATTTKRAMCGLRVSKASTTEVPGALQYHGGMTGGCEG